MEDTRATVDGGRDGGGIKDVNGEDGDAGLGFGVECEEMRWVGIGEDCGVDFVVWVLF